MRKLAQRLGWSFGTRVMATNRALALVGMHALMVAAIPSAEAQIYSFQGKPDGAYPVECSVSSSNSSRSSRLRYGVVGVIASVRT